MPHDGPLAVPGDSWKHPGVRVIPADTLDPSTVQTPGMNRAAAINAARVGAQKIRTGTVHIYPDAKTGAHHHGALDSVIYVMRSDTKAVVVNLDIGPAEKPEQLMWSTRSTRRPAAEGGSAARRRRSEGASDPPADRRAPIPMAGCALPRPVG